VIEGGLLRMPKAFGSWLIIIGIVLLVVGILINSGMLSWFGRLPGDIRIERENVRFYFPVVTMIVISIVLSLVAYFVGKFWK
jgi:membrane protein implicated in regulation of membrane protease activity